MSPLHIASPMPCPFTTILTHSMVQSPSWAANWFADSQEISRISRNPKVHYRTHKRPPPVSIPDRPNPVHIPTSHLLEIRPNIIHSSTPRFPQWSLSLRFPHQDPIHPLVTLISHIYFWDKTLHVSDSSSVHHRQFFTVHTAVVYVIQVCWQLASRIRMIPSWSCSQAVWHIPLLCLQWKTPDDGQRNCPKLVELYSKNKFD